MSDVASVNGQSLGKDQFLQLFTTQARMQNPMSPMEGSDFLAQLAQFSSLEQMGNLNVNFQKLLSVQQGLQAGAMVGKTVSYLDVQTGELEAGRVSAVRLTSSGPVLVVGTAQVPISQVTSIFEDVSQNAGQAAAPQF